MPPESLPNEPVRRLTARWNLSKRATNALRRWRPRPSAALERPVDGCHRARMERPDRDDQARGQGDAPGRCLEDATSKDRRLGDESYSTRAATRAADRRRNDQEAQGRLNASRDQGEAVQALGALHTRARVSADCQASRRL